MPPVDTTQRLLNHHLFSQGEHTGFVRVGPKGYFLPNKYKEEALNIFTMEVRPSDIFVASYPRSGNSMTPDLFSIATVHYDRERSKKTTRHFLTGDLTRNEIAASTL